MHDLLRMNIAPFGGHQNMRVGHASHDQDVRGLAHLIGFLVSDQADLPASFAPPSSSQIEAGNPEPGTLLDFAIFDSLSRSLQREAARLSGGESESRRSIIAGLAILRTHGDFLHLRIIPAIADKFDVYGRAHRMPVIIARRNDRDDFVAGLVDIAFGGDTERELAISGQDEIDTGNFAIGIIGDARLDAITQIAPALIGLRGNVNDKLAVGVELLGLLVSLA